MENGINVPYIVYEGAEAKSERIIRRLIIALILSIILTFASNIFWIYEFCEFDFEDTITTVDANDGTANYVGRDGDITYGTDYSPQAQS